MSSGKVRPGSRRPHSTRPTSFRVRKNGKDMKWVFPQIMEYPQNGWLKMMENPNLKWMIWGYHYFWKHHILKNHSKLIKTIMAASKNRGILPPKWMVKIMENRKKQEKEKDENSASIKDTHQLPCREENLSQ